MILSRLGLQWKEEALLLVLLRVFFLGLDGLFLGRQQEEDEQGAMLIIIKIINMCGWLCIITDEQHDVNRVLLHHTQRRQGVGWGGVHSSTGHPTDHQCAGLNLLPPDAIRNASVRWGRDDTLCGVCASRIWMASSGRRRHTAASLLIPPFFFSSRRPPARFLRRTTTTSVKDRDRFHSLTMPKQEREGGE
eukprot:gene989-584_t